MATPKDKPTGKRPPPPHKEKVVKKVIERTREELLEQALKGMVESYELLVSSESPFNDNPIALSAIEGFFVGEVPNAKKLLKTAPQPQN